MIKGSSIKRWIIVGVVSVAFLVCCFLLYIAWNQRHKIIERRNLRMQSIQMERTLNLWRIEESSSDFSIYDYSQIKAATNNFAPESVLGEGGFGRVYMGYLPDGLEIAVKRLAACSGQGLLEFKTEIQLIARLQHTNLVKLLGCCIQRDEKMLIYEYMPNKSLDFFIFCNVKGPLLNWTRRLHIIEGIAQGLLYLHQHSRLRVVHRDLKASNILLDSDMTPKISDFGMARIFCANMTEANTTRVVGTYGYIAPEYASDGIFSVKSDVYSFGVIVLEIISGKKTACFYQLCGKYLNLTGYAWQLWKDGRWPELVDPSLGNDYQATEIMRCIQVALMCVQDSADDRPAMSEVVVMLSNQNINLSEPKQPAYFNVRFTTEDISTSYVTAVNTLTGITIADKTSR